VVAAVKSRTHQPFAAIVAHAWRAVVVVLSFSLPAQSFATFVVAIRLLWPAEILKIQRGP
jgi:tRNA(Glu) U13 pseudouridine synthase TruD